jgi:hypothetical protein
MRDVIAALPTSNSIVIFELLCQLMTNHPEDNAAKELQSYFSNYKM